MRHSDQSENCFAALPKKLKLWRCQCCLNLPPIPFVAGSPRRITIRNMDDLYAGSCLCLIQKTALKSHSLHRGKTVAGFVLLQGYILSLEMSLRITILEI